MCDHRAFLWRFVCCVALAAWFSGFPVANDSAAESIYHFLVGEIHPTHYDSYVLALTDPADIAHARDLIHFGPDAAGEAIVVAKVALGRDGINRNYVTPGAPLWSWHVAEFISFADTTAEILDGGPRFLGNYKDDPEYSCCGIIGFWGYTVVAEFPTGDYDDDTDVDHFDVAIWRTTYGSASELRADGNGDGTVDAADYVVWRNNFGSSITIPPHLLGPTTGASITVPEPAAPAAALVTISLCITWWRGGCRRADRTIST
jgi:hypothetical protein